MTIDKRLGCFYKGLDSDFYAQFYLGLCEVALPAPEDIQGLYLANSSINFDTNTITDESGSGNDATLVESNCITGDGVAYATAPDTTMVYTETTLHLKASSNLPTNAANQMICSQYNAGVGGFFLQQLANGGKLVLVVYDNTGTVDSYQIPDSEGASITKAIELDFNAGNLAYTYNGVSGSTTMTATTIGAITTAKFTVLGLQRVTGQVWDIEAGEHAWACAEGNGYMLHDTNTSSPMNLTFSGYTLATLWGTKQPYNHFNLEKGHSQYIYCDTDGLLYKENTTFESLEFNFVAPSVGKIQAYSLLSDKIASRYNFYGYAFIIEGNNQNVYLRRVDDDGVTTNNVVVLNNQFTNGLAYQCKITRSVLGEWEILFKGNEYADWTSIGIGTDNTYSSGSYFVIDNDTNDVAGSFVLNGSKIDFKDMTISTGAYSIIRYPASSTNIGKDVLGFNLTNPAVQGHNGAETKIQLPASLSSVQDVTPIASITNNKNLRWVGGSLINARLVVSGTSTIYEDENGDTVIDASNGDIAYFSFPCVIELDKTYKYYIDVVSNSGSFQLSSGSSGIGNAIYNSGVVKGDFIANSDFTSIGIKRNGAGIYVVSKFYVWEDGTVPPLSYEEMQTNFNLADRVFMKNECKNKKSLVLYNRQLTTAELLQVQKALNVNENDCDVVVDEDTGLPAINEDTGLIFIDERG